jgi:hypothetical protein
MLNKYVFETHELAKDAIKTLGDKKLKLIFGIKG